MESQIGKTKHSACTECQLVEWAGMERNLRPDSFLYMRDGDADAEAAVDANDHSDIVT